MVTNSFEQAPRRSDDRGQRRQPFHRDIRCYNCYQFGHIQRDCPQPGRQGQRQQRGRQKGSRPTPRTTKWCSLHNTHLHSDAECNAQATQRNAGGNPQAGRGQRQANSFNMRRNNRVNEANFSTLASYAQGMQETQSAAVGASPVRAHAQPTEETAVEGTAATWVTRVWLL